MLQVSYCYRTLEVSNGSYLILARGPADSYDHGTLFCQSFKTCAIPNVVFNQFNMSEW
jgi:hypothetical protein